MNGQVTNSWSAPRWLRFWAGGTLLLLFVLLTLGAIVTSFRVGMADPIWPTRPWQLAIINWQEQDRGFVIEHTHRLTGFVVGGAVAVLAIGLWLTERKPMLRWGGLAAIVALLGAFGQLHGTLIQQQRLYREAQEIVTSPTQLVELPQPNWVIAAGPTLVALILVGAATLSALCFGSPGRGVRALGVVLLVGVMAQGMLGGLRVYLDALLGAHLAAIHGISSQIVLALAVALFVTLRPQRYVLADDRMQHEAAARRLAVITALLVFGQVVAGAILRHTQSSLGPRLHLLLAFAVLAAAIVLGRLLADAPRAIRRLKTLLHAVIGVQLLLGIETWITKYAHGFAAAPFQPVGESDAILRTAHTVVGYLVFAVSVALALRLTANRIIDSRLNLRLRELESVA
jgi:heme A synthase